MRQILCFGDSNTYGLIPGTTRRYDWDTRWTGRLERKLAPAGCRVVEEGLCGRTTVFEDPARGGRRGIDLLPAILESHSPVALTVVMLGTNDCKKTYGASPEEIGEGVREILRKIRSHDEQARVLLVSPIRLGQGVGEPGFDPEFDEESVEKSKRLKEVYRQAAAEYGCEFLGASDYAGPSKTDREHLDPEGHAALAEAFYEKIQEMS